MSTFPCPDCGGKKWHVEALCGIFRAEREAERDRAYEVRQGYLREQEARMQRLIVDADPIVKIENGYSLRLTFASGMVLVAYLTGQEMDGHFDNSPQRLAVRVLTPEEAKRPA